MDFVGGGWVGSDQKRTILIFLFEKKIVNPFISVVVNGITKLKNRLAILSTQK